jgi:23S rRNA (guanine2445-N2)-methyltransferase / 23S rRNA (guanine2069-N7)-methyltransferase
VTERLSYFAPCARGVEPLLADELRRIGSHGVRPQRGGVLFTGNASAGLQVALWSRLASRVLLSLGTLDGSSADALYEQVRAIAWEDHVTPTGTIAVDANGVNAALRNTQFTAVRVKDAIADRFRDRTGERPSVDTRSPDLRVNIVIAGDKARLAIDLSGEPLHRRGYREQGVQVAAPMKETLAAAVLEVAGWREIAAAGGAFLDPMCGSGTLAIEAAMIAADIAPGLLRPSSAWGFSRWLGLDIDAWETLVERAEARRERGLRRTLDITGSDADAGAVRIAADCAARAGLEKEVALRVRRLDEVERPEGADTGLLAMNPPYGERLAERAQLPGLYAEISRVARRGFVGWSLAVISPDERLAEGLAMRPRTTVELYNGRILAPVSVFDVTESPAAGLGTAEGLALDESGTAFANRLRKMARHTGQWARRTGVTCYRIYDADLPDFNLAVDIYEGAGQWEGRIWAHVAEYAPPSGVDPVRAAERMELATAVVAEVLGIEIADVFVKRRERQRGTAQYERAADRGVVVTVAENGLLFEVNLSDYLDTGLFLDHRDTRAWLRDQAAEKRFLNLFAYTGTASVYAAAGGASRTTTVDLSSTYLEWAGRNLERNGFGGASHELIRADVTSWLDEAARRQARYDLIFCDPPTFSNSKRMEDTWDVQRDHADLLVRTGALLAEGGTLVFSCNRRRFTLDEEALAAAGMSVRDISKRTIPKDFERNPRVHSCWVITRGGAA